MRMSSILTISKYCNLSTACTVLNIRGEFFTKLVKMNSNLEFCFANTHSACVCPRSFDFAFRMLIEMIVLSPMPNVTIWKSDEMNDELDHAVLILT